MGYVPPPPRISDQLARLHAIYSIVPGGGDNLGAPIRLNLDRHGLPRDYATYVWLLYKRVVTDDSPARRAFLHGTRGAFTLPDPDPDLIGRSWV